MKGGEGRRGPIKESDLERGEPVIDKTPPGLKVG